MPHKPHQRLTTNSKPLIGKVPTVRVGNTRERHPDGARMHAAVLSIAGTAHPSTSLQSDGRHEAVSFTFESL
jgi:hypothetical protein